MNNELLRLEQELIKGCGMAQERFHRVSSAKWKGIYQKITEEYADKTKTWKNGRLLSWQAIPSALKAASVDMVS